MKKIGLLLFFFVALTFSSQAQAPNYVDWEWDILKFGFVEPTSGNNTSSGIEWATELRYNVRDDLSIGLAFQGAAFSTDFDDDNFDLGVAGAFLINGDYYLKTNSNTRAFLGLGFGRFGDGTLEIRNGNAADDIIEGSDSVGLAPRFGFELGHGRLLAQYNYSFKESTTDYFSISLALTLWGGYKPQ